MEELKINVPEGYEIDKENSTFDCIKFKPIKVELTYDDIAKELFEEKETFWVGHRDNIILERYGVDISYADSDNCTSEAQVRKLLALNRLMNVAKYLNEGWLPDWNNKNQYKYFFNIGHDEGIVKIYRTIINNGAGPHFKSEDIAKQALKILGENTIELALTTNW